MGNVKFTLYVGLLGCLAVVPAESYHTGNGERVSTFTVEGVGRAVAVAADAIATAAREDRRLTDKELKLLDVPTLVSIVAGRSRNRREWAFALRTDIVSVAVQDPILMARVVQLLETQNLFDDSDMAAVKRMIVDMTNAVAHRAKRAASAKSAATLGIAFDFDSLVANVGGVNSKNVDTSAQLAS